MPHPPPPAASRQSDRRRRGRRAAGVGRQGARRERARRRRAADRRRHRARRQEAAARRGRRRGDGRRRTRGWRSSGTRRARSPAPTISRRFARSGFAARRCPSIASVSHFTLRTRARGSATGTEIRVNGGTVVVGARGRRARGHVDRGRDLFYNLPARRKFLKSDTAESAQISRLVTQLALGYPEVGFSLTSGGRACSSARRQPDCASASFSCSANAPT